MAELIVIYMNKIKRAEIKKKKYVGENPALKLRFDDFQKWVKNEKRRINKRHKLFQKTLKDYIE